MTRPVNHFYLSQHQFSIDANFLLYLYSSTVNSELRVAKLNAKIKVKLKVGQASIKQYKLDMSTDQNLLKMTSCSKLFRYLIFLKK